MIGKPRMILASASLVAVWIVCSPFLAKWLIVEKRLDHADALMVLSGSAVYKERTRTAAELYKDKASLPEYLSLMTANARVGRRRNKPIRRMSFWNNANWSPTASRRTQ